MKTKLVLTFKTRMERKLVMSIGDHGDGAFLGCECDVLRDAGYPEKKTRISVRVRGVFGKGSQRQLRASV